MGRLLLVGSACLISTAMTFCGGLIETKEAPPTPPPAQPTTVQPKEPEKPPTVPFRGVLHADEFRISIHSAEYKKPKVTGLLGDESEGENVQLVVTFKIKNSTERKILRFADNDFSTSFELHDDAGNQIRRVTYGLGSEITGALTDNDDILPGALVTHVEVFLVPPPKTESLVLTMDRAVLGDEGVVDFEIPLDRIETVKTATTD